MTTAWEVRGGQDRIRLDASGRGEVTFTVTNPSDEQDRAVFEVVSPEADAAWFEVDEPERLVLPGWTAAYQVRIAVPPDAAVDRFHLVGRARSAADDPDTAASWVSSQPVAARTGKRGPSASPGRRGLLIGLAALAALVVLAGIGVGVFLLTRSGEVETPSLAGYSESSARRELTELGLKVGDVRHRHDPDANVGEIRDQRPGAGTEVKAGTAVDLEVAVHLDSPTPMAPADQDTVDGRRFPHLEWSPVSGAEGYRVTVERQWCVRAIGSEDCTWVRDQVDITGTTSARPTLPKDNEDAFSGRVRWQVAALDAFGETGPSSERFVFTQR